MKPYVIQKIYADGYERVAILKELGKERTCNVHFLEYDEYLQHGEESRKKEQGTVLEGNLSIELVTFSKTTDATLSHYQTIPASPHIEATIEVSQIIDKYSVYARSSLSDNTILIEFEHAVNYKAGERVWVSGSLELSEV